MSRKQNIIKINKIDNDYETVVTKGTTGRDIEIGLARFIIDISERERQIGHSEFKEETLLNAIRGWVRCIKQDQ